MTVLTPECIWDHRIQWSYYRDYLSIASPIFYRVMHVQLSRDNLTKDWILRVVGRYLPVGADIATSLPQRDCGQIHSGHGQIFFFLLYLCGWILLVHHFNRCCQFRLKLNPESSLLILIAVCSQSGQNTLFKMVFMASANKCTGHQVCLCFTREGVYLQHVLFWVTNVLYLASKEELLYRAFHHDILEVVVSLSFSMLKLVDEKSG